MRPRSFIRPVTTRSTLVLEMGYELARDNRWPYQRATVTMQPQGGGPSYVLLGSDSYMEIPRVARGEAHLAIINPASPLTLAVRGAGPFKEPIPLRAIAVIPSADAFAFAVRKSTGITSLEEIKERRHPLRVSLRGQRDHTNHFFEEQVLAALGFSLDDIVGWGGQVHYDPGLPNGISTSGPDIQVSRLERVKRGERDAVFDEAIRAWVPQALDLDMRVLSLSKPVVKKLEAWGFRRNYLRKAQYPKLEGDVLTLDFSGWPIYTHASVPDEVITAFCQTLDAAKGRIPWEGQESLPLEQMVKDSPEAPLDIPLHPAAERYWRQRGYL